MKMTLHSNDVDYISDKQNFIFFISIDFSCIFSRFTDSIYVCSSFLFFFPYAHVLVVLLQLMCSISVSVPNAAAVKENERMN